MLTSSDIKNDKYKKATKFYLNLYKFNSIASQSINYKKRKGSNNQL